MKIPFSFWGGAELKLPVLSQVSIASTGYDNIQLNTTLLYEGTEAPPIEVGFLLSETNANPEIGGANVQQQPATVPGSIPGVFVQGFDSLTPLTDYYVRAYATNSEGTVYNDVVQQSTAADALSFRYVQNNSNPGAGLIDITWDGVGVLQLLEDGADAGSIQGFGAELTSTVSRPSSSTGKILQIFPSQGGTMYEFTFQNGNQTVATHPNGVNLSMLSFGSTQWRNFQFCWKGVASSTLFTDVTDKPNLTSVSSMRQCFYIDENFAPYPQDMYTAGNTVNGQFSNNNDIGLWNVSNVENFNECFHGRKHICRDGGQFAHFKLNWSCDSLQTAVGMFEECRNTGNSHVDSGFDLSEFTIQEGQTGAINVNLGNMFRNCLKWTGDLTPTFGPNVNPNMNINFGDTFAYLNDGRGDAYNTTKLTLDPSWATAFSGNDMSVWNGAGAAGMFQRVRGLRVDFTDWQFGGFFTYQNMFHYTDFHPQDTPNWSTMLSNKDFTHTGFTNDGVKFNGMFNQAQNVPTLNNWTIYDTIDFTNMFGNISGIGTYPAAEIDFSTWTFDWTYTNQFLNQELKFNQMFFGLNSAGNNSIEIKGLSSFTLPAGIGGAYQPNSISMYGMFQVNKSGSAGSDDGVVWDQSNNDISGWNVSNVYRMDEMFRSNGTTSNISNLDLSSWNVANVTNCTDFSFLTTWPSNQQPTFTACTP